MVGFESSETIIHCLLHHGLEKPDVVAYRFLHDKRDADVLTFGRLAERVCALAGKFRETVGVGERAILLYPPGLEFVEAFLGCLAAGIIAVPAYPPRRNRKADLLRAIVDDADPRIMLSTRQILTALGAEMGGMKREISSLATDDIELPLAAGLKPELPSPELIAFLQYTSGSTGTPKGVMVTHGNIVANERQIEASFGHSSESVMVSWLPFYHDMGLIGGVLQPLYVGFTSILLSPKSFAQDPIHWLRAISDHRGTTSGAPNFAYDHCVTSVTEKQKLEIDLTSLRVLYNGAEPVRADTLDRFAAAFAACGFSANRFFPCYGMAETTLFVSGGPPNAGPKRLWVDADALEAGRIEVKGQNDMGSKCLIGSGVPAANTDLRIVDPNARCAVQARQVGEIWIRSPSVSAGYWNRPDDTRVAFDNWLANTGEGPFLSTGDLGFLDEGVLYVTGRIKDLLIVRGRNIYPQDIEATIAASVDFIEPTACAAIPLGEAEDTIGIVAEADRDIARIAKTDPAKILNVISRIRAVVSNEYDVAVALIVLLVPGSFPRTTSGKVQRRRSKDVIKSEPLSIAYKWPMDEPASKAATAVSDASVANRIVDGVTSSATGVERVTSFLALVLALAAPVEKLATFEWSDYEPLRTAVTLRSLENRTSESYYRTSLRPLSFSRVGTPLVIS